mmetsp:Transcript_22297/g.53027  ORF Transcript_22297/g.53027 Transcript_22297/m.53027 type:complete len:245 (-) Transcript_22297:302-1036(-)
MTPSTTGAKEGLSAYERLRLAKIARNEEHLKSLGLAKKPILKSIQNQPSGSKRKRNEKTLDRTFKQPRKRYSERLKENKTAQAKKKNLHMDPQLENAKDWMNKHSFGDAEKGRGEMSSERSRKRPVKKRKATSGPSVIDDLRDYERDAFFALREWKRARGRELGYSNPCVICHNRTLVEMCRLVPDDEESLLGVWGISIPRLEQHGELMLEALAPWRKQLREGHAKYNRTHDDGEYYKSTETSR